MRKYSLKYWAGVTLSISVMVAPAVLQGLSVHLVNQSKPKFINVETGEISHDPFMGARLDSIAPFDALKIYANEY